MAKKKPFKFTKKQKTIAGIVASVAICGLCVITDLCNSISQSDYSLRDDETLNKVITGFENISGNAEKAAEEYKLNENISAFQEIAEAAEGELNGDNLSAGITKETGTVVRVVDGDTYVLNINGEETKVRLIGVDTPESVAPADYSKENTEEGKEVSDIVKEKIQAGDKLAVEYDVSPTDKYGRTLAYLYFDDGTMVQEWLLKNGYAQCMTIQPNSRYADHFAEIQHEAAENKVGLWNGFFEEE